MKKLLLSGFVVLMFIIYSIQQRHESSTAVVAPLSLTTSSQPTPSPTSTSGGVSPSTVTPSMSPGTTSYKDGSYTGEIADAFYGNIQVKVTIQSNKISDIVFLQYPNDRRNSIEINQYAMPYLKQEAIKAQNAHVDIVSGATDTSNAFVQSLATALAKAS